MKAALLLIMIFSTAGLTYAYPQQIEEMEVKITSTVKGEIFGELSKSDKATMKYISIPEFEEQEIIELNEKLLIGEKEILPSHEEMDGIRYAVYELENLEGFNSREFQIIRDARIKRKSTIDLKEQQTETREEFLKETDFIEMTEELKKQAEQFSSDDELETIRKTAEWVKQNIEYDYENYYGVMNGAKETFEKRKGVCDEYANLTASFLRINKIPARFVTGISFDGERFGLHGWVEAQTQKYGWIGVDSTYGEAGYLDAGHFAIAKTSDANQVIDFQAITETKNKIEIKTVLPEPKVEVISQKKFENILEANIYLPENAEEKEKFTLKLKITNKKGEKIVPVEIVIPEDFQAREKSRIVHLKRGETQLEWEVTAPGKKTEKNKQYEIKAIMPDQTITEKITIGKKQEIIINKNTGEYPIEPLILVTGGIITIILAGILIVKK